LTTLAKLIRQPVSTVFRRAYIKRRSSSTGLYESTWFEITDFIKSWGRAVTAIDDVRLNRFSQSGLNLLVRNDSGAFNIETNSDSLWNGYLTRYRTLVKLEAGYNDTAGNEFPTDSSLGIYIMDGEIQLNTKTNDTTLRLKSIVAPFSEFRADEIGGLSGSMTASEIMGKIRDSTDGSGNFLFRNFITSTSWLIQTTTQLYPFLTVQVPNLSVWELMNKLAEAEGFILVPTRFGGIDFRDRTERTSTSQFSFYGQQYSRMNIISIDSTKEAVDKLYTNFRLKFNDADTATSYVTAGEATIINNSSTSWKYGRRNYEFENLMVNTAGAQAIVNALLSNYSALKLEVNMTTKFVPDVEISDAVDVSYKTFDLTGSRLWDLENWASDASLDPFDGLSWDSDNGESINFDARMFKVLSKMHDLDRFTTSFVLREV